MAWFVTLPELLATGEAVAETPPTVSAKLCVGNNPIKQAPITE